MLNCWFYPNICMNTVYKEITSLTFMLHVQTANTAISQKHTELIKQKNNTLKQQVKNSRQWLFSIQLRINPSIKITFTLSNDFSRWYKCAQPLKTTASGITIVTSVIGFRSSSGFLAGLNQNQQTLFTKSLVWDQKC